VAHLEDWGTLEQWWHWNLQSLRVPVSGGAKVYIEISLILHASYHYLQDEQLESNSLFLSEVIYQDYSEHMG
jgi:hypothetical protein